MTERVIDIGGLAIDEPDYEGPVLVVFAIDPGVATGWSAWKVPVRLLADGGVGRTLARCRHRYGTILRSPVGAPRGAGASYSRTDGQHVTAIFERARVIYDDWMETFFDCEECDGDGWVFGDGENGTKKTLHYICKACEGEKGEVGVPEGYEFVFVMESFTLRLMDQDPALLAPVRVGSVFMDRMEQNGSPTPVFFQSPSDAKTTVTDQRLKGWGLYDRGSGAHARDADRHGVLFIRNFMSNQSLREQIYGYDPL